jgi:phenol 2-monooxygenase
MNVSMQDAFNLGWKLVSVLRKRCPPSLLHTYSAERRALAKELIDFDREWAALLASTHEEGGGADPAKTQDYFIKHGRYTAGTATHYSPSILTGESICQRLAEGFVVGKRHSAPVIRLADAKPTHSRHVVKATDDLGSSPLPRAIRPPVVPSVNWRFCRERSGPLSESIRRGDDIDAVIEVCSIPTTSS